jgi:hypothetical protein
MWKRYETGNNTILDGITTVEEGDGGHRRSILGSKYRGPGTDCEQLRIAVWTGDARDTRPFSDIDCALQCEITFANPAMPAS